jgi:hypothetical protein
MAASSPNAVGNVITEFTVVPRNRAGINVDYHPCVFFNPSRQKGFEYPKHKDGRV